MKNIENIAAEAAKEGGALAEKWFRKGLEVAGVKTGSVQERVRLIADAYNAVGKSRMIDSNPRIVAFHDLMVIAEALNEKWIANWGNETQHTWYPLFYMHPTKGLEFEGANAATTRSYAGSNLCFRSKELAEYAAKQFIDVYKKFML